MFLGLVLRGIERDSRIYSPRTISHMSTTCHRVCYTILKFSEMANQLVLIFILTTNQEMAEANLGG